MTIRKTNQKISLSRRIFQYLIGAIIFSQITFGAFWITGQFHSYRKEIQHLKETFSETKKAEIKAKILEIKDFIYWVRNNPGVYLTREMQVVLNTKIDSILKKGNATETELLERCKTSVMQTKIPTYILNKNNQVIYSNNLASNNIEQRKRLSGLAKLNKKNGWKTIPVYGNTNHNDSVIEAVVRFNTNASSDYILASVASPEYFDKLLKEYVLDTLCNLRFTKDEYVFVNSFDGLALLSNGKRNIPARDIFKSKDSLWVKVFEIERQAASRQEGVFYTYTWQKISAEKTATKTSYFAFVPEWKWIIGTGFYADDVNLLIELKRKALYDDLRKGILNSLGFMVLSTALCYLIVLFFARKLKRNIEVFRSFFGKAANESSIIDKIRVSYKEFDYMADAANLMVDEREKAKAAALKSEEKFAKAFKNSPDAIFISTLTEGIIIEANESTARITGYKLSELIGRSTLVIRFWNKPEDRKHYVALLSKSGRVENYEAGIHMKSGEIRHALISGEKIDLGDDEYIVNVIHDITERRDAERTLKMKEEQYRFLFERNPASMVIYDRNTLKLISVNESFQKHYGYSNREISSMLLPDLYPEDEREPLVQLIKELHGHVYVGEWHHLKKDGTLINIIATSNDLVYMGSKARIAVVTDITERRQVEEKIQLKERQLSLIFDNVFDAIYLYGVESKENFRFLSVNQTFLNLTGLKEEQVVNKLVHEIIPEPSLTMVVDNYKTAMREKRTVQWEETSRYPAGKKTGLVTITPLFDANDNCINLIGTVHDITEHKIAEENIRELNQSLEVRVAERTSQLSAINKELESFSYSISHDLRAPLRAIFGFSQILARRHRESLNDEGRQYMDYIVEASIRMEQLINDLLNYSRLGRKSINIHPVALNEIIESIESDFKQKLEEVNARFVVEGELPTIQGDESLLLQIFTNLIENAITYRRQDEPLAIVINCERSQGWCLLKFTDNGIGIPKEYWGKIFNIFQRLHSEDQYPGTGIGLATVKKAVTMLGGTVWVDSIVGKGSTFYVNLPEPKL